jgi:transcriptional regulator with XRE-family HTH domain
MTQVKDFNNLNVWLKGHLDRRGWSVERLSREAGLSRAIIYFYMNDTYRPDEESIANVCKALGVPVTEGLKQYTPRVEGRPRQREGRARRPYKRKR